MTRALAYAALAATGALWVTWPDARAAPVGVAALIAAGVLLNRGARAWTLLALGVAAVTTALAPADVTAWRAWASAVLLLAPVDAALRGGTAAPRGAWLKTSGVLAALALVAGLAAVWRPARAALAGDAGVVTATLLLAGAGAAIALWVTGADEAPSEGR